jgi:hypothetical protein
MKTILPQRIVEYVIHKYIYIYLYVHVHIQYQCMFTYLMRIYIYVYYLLIFSNFMYSLKLHV